MIFESMRKYVGNIFLGVGPDIVCPAGVLVVSQCCFVGRWCLGCPLARPCIGNVLTMLGHVLGVLLMSWWCSCDVLVAIRGGAIVVVTECFLRKLIHLSWRQKNETLVLGVVWWMTLMSI